MRLGFYVLSALAAAGILASQKLVETHVQTKVLGAGDSGLCGAADFLSCADAAESVYATIGNLPIASLGLAWYAVVLLLACLIGFGGDKVKGAPEVLFVGSGLGVLYSVFLAIVSLAVLGKLCPYCVGLYVVNIGLFVTAWLLLPAGPKAALKRLPGLLTQNATWLPIASLGLAWYAVVLLLAGLMRFVGDKVKGAPEVLFVGSGLGVLYSVFLAIVSLAVLGKLCPYCVGLYVVNIGLFVTAWRMLPDGSKAALAGLPGLLGKNATWITVGAMVVAVLVTQGMYAQAHATLKQKLAEVRAAQTQKPAHFDIDTSGTAGKGPADAPVVLVEYSDFECPYCKRLADALDELAKREPTLVRIHFKQFPMDMACNDTMERPLHDQACGAAVAAVCAERQGKLWPMHDLLFQNARALSGQAYLDFAAKVGVDVEAFRACLDDPTALQRVKDDIAEGARMGVRGTPTFFVNGWRHEGARDPDKLQGIVRLAAEQAKKKAAKAAEAP